jgi:hypothetical protein
VVGVMLLISLPAVVIAWLKLRQRTLGPVLDANGWAINGRVKINIPFGTALTALAVRPPGSRRTLEDPYQEKSAAGRIIAFLLVMLLLAAAAVRVDHQFRGHYFWQTPPPAAALPPAR